MNTNKNIKLLCKARGITFAELAARLNESRQTLHRQTTGNPTTGTLERIAAALQVPAWIILHPAPLAALQAGRFAAIEDQTGTPAPALVFCPVCKNPLTIQAARSQQAATVQDRTRAQEESPEGPKEGQPERRKPGRPRKDNGQI